MGLGLPSRFRVPFASNTSAFMAPKGQETRLYDHDTRNAALGSRILDRGLLGLVARSGSDYFEGWGLGSGWSCRGSMAGDGWVEALLWSFPGTKQTATYDNVDFVVKYSLEL